MAYTEAQKRATAKYVKSHLEEIKIRVPKDGTKERYKKQAEKRSKSLNAYIIGLIEADISSELSPDE